MSLGAKSYESVRSFQCSGYSWGRAFDFIMCCCDMFRMYRPKIEVCNGMWGYMGLPRYLVKHRWVPPYFIILTVIRNPLIKS